MLTNESNYLCGRPGYASGGTAFLLTLITCNIYGLYRAYKMGEKIDFAKQSRGWPSSNSGILYLILELLIPVVGWALMQNEINNMIAAMPPMQPPMQQPPMQQPPMQ